MEKKTNFKDSNGNEILGGMVVEYWDNEGGGDAGVVDFIDNEWVIWNPFKDKFQGFKSIAPVENFAPKNIHILNIHVI